MSKGDKRPVVYTKKDRALLIGLFEQSCATDFQSFIEGFAAGQRNMQNLMRAMDAEYFAARARKVALNKVVANATADSAHANETS